MSISLERWRNALMSDELYDEVSRLQAQVAELEEANNSAAVCAEHVKEFVGDNCLVCRIAELEGALVKCAIPYEAILMDRPSQKWIAPKVWRAIEEAVTAVRATLLNQESDHE